MKITKISTVDMPHEEWLEHRRHHIGGSDASTIVGLNPYSSLYELWADKLGKIPPKEENEAMRLGHDLEEYVAKRFAEATGKKVRRENNILVNSDYTFAHANVDRLIVGEKAGLECKTTNALNMKKFKGGNFPPVYYVQCQHYMMVTGYKKWYLAVLILGKEFLWFEIERNDEDIEALKQAEMEFWKLVETETPPAVDGSMSCSRTIDSIYSESDDERIDLTPLHSALVTRDNVSKQIAELTAIKNEQENIIKSYMEECEQGECDGFRVTWKKQTRSTLDKNKLQEEHPEIDLSQYMKTSESRVFKVKAYEG